MELLPPSNLERAFRSGLKLGHLRMLTTLARVGRVGRVAELFNVTQPAISKQIGELESLLGTSVVTRAGRRVVLTPAGEVLVKYGKQVLYSLDSARRDIEELQAGLAGKLKVGAVPTVMPTLVTAGISRLRRRAPAITITMMESTTDAMFPLMREGELDLVISRTRIDRCLAQTQDLEEKPVARDPVVIACASHHPLAGRKSLRWTDLASYPWILPPQGSAIHEDLMRMFARHQLSAAAGAITANCITVLPGLLADGRSVGLIPRAYAREYADHGTLAVLPLVVPGAAGVVHAVWRRERVTPVLRLFLQSLNEAAEELG